MRIVILSIALLFCAFTAHSQVLKSAGVWYFLDVDSMTARPAVLPNGTELAYVIGTKKIYYWNRTTSTWTEYSAGGGGLTMPFDSIYFNPTTADPDTAELKYNADLETFVFGADGTIIEIGQKSAWYVKNQTGSTITKGTVVRASGTLGSSGRILVSPMVIDGTVDSKYLLGITASDIADGSDGYVIHFGKLRKFNTSAWSDGAVLYAGTGGTLTATEPSPPNLRLPIAFVVHSHATNGILAIRIQTGNELHELHDVDTIGIDNGGVLVWNAASEKWEASDGTAITTADTTSLLATKYWTNSNFFPLQGGTLTGTGGAGFIGFPSQVSAPGTPASGLNVYAQGSSFNWKGTDGYERQFASTLTGGRTYTLPDVSGTFTLGTGTTDRSARWSATNTVTTGNFTDNGTKVQALLPFQFQTYTTAGLPTGVTGYTLYNTTLNGIGWYNGTRWAYALESTAPTFTAGRPIYTDANGQATTSGNLTYTGTRLQTGGSFRIGRSNVANDTISLEKFEDGNSRIFRVNNPGSTGGWASGFVFRGGFNGVISTANTFRIYTNSSTLPGSVYIGNVPESGASAANSSTNLGVLNKITSTGSYDTGINLNPNGLSPNNFGEYSLTNSKHFGIFIGGQGGTNSLRNFSDIGYGVYAGYQYQPLVNGYGSSWVFLAKTEASSQLEILRLQGKDGNICLGCTNAQYQLYTTNTGAYGIPRGTVAQRPTIVTSTTPIRFNTDSTALEYGESVGTWRQLATRAYARSLVNAISTANIGNTDLSLTGNRTLHGAGYTLAFNANTTVRDSFIIGNLPEFDSEYITIADNSTGLQGKKKFLMPATNAYDGTSTGFFNDDFVLGMQSSGTNIYGLSYIDSTGYFEMTGSHNSASGFTSIYGNGGSGIKYLNLRVKQGTQIHALDMGLDGVFYNTDNFSEIFRADSSGIIRFSQYGTGTKEAADLSKTQSNYIAGFATDGTVLDLERKRDTTIFVTADTDYDFSAAVTTAQIARRYNRIIIHMTLTSGVGADKTTTLHTPDANLMQCEILIRGTDNTGTYDNEINFGTNNAISSDGTNASGYTLAQGQGLHVRVVYNGSNYKYIYY